MTGQRATVMVQHGFDPKPGAWRTFEITTRVELPKPAMATRAWIPVPSVEGDYQKVLGDVWSGNAANVELVSDAKYGAKMLAAQWRDGETVPAVEVTSRFRARDRGTDLVAQLAGEPHDPLLQRPRLRHAREVEGAAVTLESGQELAAKRHGLSAVSHTFSSFHPTQRDGAHPLTRCPSP